MGKQNCTPRSFLKAKIVTGANILKGFKRKHGVVPRFVVHGSSKFGLCIVLVPIVMGRF